MSNKKFKISLNEKTSQYRTLQNGFLSEKVSVLYFYFVTYEYIWLILIVMFSECLSTQKTLVYQPKPTPYLSWNPY